MYLLNIELKNCIASTEIYSIHDSTYPPATSKYDTI